ncbi:MAG: hypothetical protein ACXU8S_14560 [Phenylobacterium sp.]
MAMGLVCAGCGQVADAQGQLVETLKIKEATSDYEKARAPLDRCVKAKLVASAYSDAKDAGETQAWEAREHEDCRAAAASAGVKLPVSMKR